MCGCGGGGGSCGFHSNDCPKSCASLHCNIYGKIINNPFHKVHPLNFKLYTKCKHSVNVFKLKFIEGKWGHIRSEIFIKGIQTNLENLSSQEKRG